MAAVQFRVDVASRCCTCIIMLSLSCCKNSITARAAAEAHAGQQGEVPRIRLRCCYCVACLVPETRWVGVKQRLISSRLCQSLYSCSTAM